jgi:predicted metalloprotease with PDZ domain
MLRAFARLSTALALVVVAVFPVAAQTPSPSVTLDVDARDVTRDVIHVHEKIAVAPGPLTLVYPKWLPGEHGPNGPIVNVTGLDVKANGTAIPWRRDLDDLFAVHLTVPPGTTSLDVGFDFLGAAVGGYSSARLSTANMLTLAWNKVLITPFAADYRSVIIAPTLHLPGIGWQYATALDTVKKDGATIVFAPTTMEQLVDSPLDAGTVARTWPLGTIDGAPVDVAAFADTPEQLEAKDATIAKLRNLVAEMGALYGARHFRHYTFLLTVSDVLPGNGVEHHQSSDDGVGGDYFLDDAAFVTSGTLLAHEFNHSWDGKYRRPADLATPNLQVPMHDDLLWVYEGMTQYYGEMQAARSGFWSPEEWRAALASTYAQLDSETGRLVRPLQDTADGAPFLYSRAQAFSGARRGTDFYSEGELMWLEADGIIRRATGGAKSLDDVARAFFGRTSTGPEVVTYTRDDIVAAMNAVLPYDWKGFFAQRIDAIAPHPPDPFTPGGWKLVFKPTRSAFERETEQTRHAFNARFSLGISGMDRGTIGDVAQNSPAAAAGIAPGAKIVAVDDRPFEFSVRALLDGAMTRAQHDGAPIRLLLLQGGRYKSVAIPYTGGPRYPNLERLPNVPDTLDAAAQPRRAGAANG